MGSRRVAQPQLCALGRDFVCLCPFRHVPCYVKLINWDYSSPTAFVQFDVGSDKPKRAGPVLISSPFWGQNCVVQAIKADISCWDRMWGWSSRSGMMCRQCSAHPRGEGWDEPAHLCYKGDQMCPCGCQDVILTGIFAVVWYVGVKVCFMLSLLDYEWKKWLQSAAWRWECRYGSELCWRIFHYESERKELKLI